MTQTDDLTRDTNAFLVRLWSTHEWQRNPLLVDASNLICRLHADRSYLEYSVEQHRRAIIAARKELSND